MIDDTLAEEDLPKPNSAPSPQATPQVIASMEELTPPEENVRKALRAHIGVVEMVYFQRANEQAVSPGHLSFGREIVSDEEPFSRNHPVTAEWAPLDLGWLNNVPLCFLRLKPVAGPLPPGIPDAGVSPEPLVVELGILYQQAQQPQTMYDSRSPNIVVRTQELKADEAPAHLINPQNLDLVRIRIKSGSGKLNVLAYPA